MSDLQIIAMVVGIYAVVIVVCLVIRSKRSVGGNKCPECNAKLGADWVACKFCGWRPQGILYFESGPLSGQSYPIAEGGTTIGSVAGSGIVLSDPAVSRVHARIQPQGVLFWVEDLGARNGLYVNGVRRERSRLAHNDRIRIGHSDAVFQIQGQAASPRDVGKRTRMIGH